MLDLGRRDDPPEPDGPPDGEGRPGPSPGVLLIAALVMIGLGYFLVVRLRDMSRIQDCVMSGRTNCAPVSGEEEK